MKLDTNQRAGLENQARTFSDVDLHTSIAEEGKQSRVPNTSTLYGLLYAALGKRNTEMAFCLNAVKVSKDRLVVSMRLFMSSAMHLCSSYRHSCCTVGLPACLCTRNNGNPLRGTLLQWCGPLSWMLCHWHGWKWTLIPEVKLGVECYSNLNHCINGQGIFTNHCVGAVISIGNNYNYGKAQ